MKYVCGTIYFDPTNKEWPWCIHRQGAVAEQGGIAYGTEESGFKTMSAALEFLEASLIRDESKVENEALRDPNG